MRDHGDLLFRGHHARRVEPPRSAYQLLARGLHRRHIHAVYRIVGDIVEIRTVLRITLNGLRIEILIRVKGRILLVGEEYPVGILRIGDAKNGEEDDGC